MKIAALLFGLMAGLFALLAPSALKTDLMTPFLELWADNPSEHLLGTIGWFAVPGAALLGGVLAAFIPGLAALLLLAAAAAWIGIGIMLPGLFDFQLIAPAASAGLAAALAFVAGELQLRQRRQRRRNRLAAVETLVEDGEFEREAALRMDPLVVPREEVTLPPKRAIPLTLDDVSVTERPSGSPPRWEDLDAADAPLRGSDIWAEAIRPEPEAQVEPELEQVPEPEPFAPPRRGAPPRGFRWDDEDLPVGQRIDQGPAPGPRLEPRRPPPGPQVQQRRPEPAPEPPWRPAPQPAAPPRPESRRPEPIPELRAESRQAETALRSEAPQRPRPQSRSDDADRWPEPQMRRAVPSLGDDEPPRKNLLAALGAAAAVLVLGLVIGGGYLAFREGWFGPIVATVQPGQTVEAPQAPASAPASAKQAEAARDRLPSQASDGNAAPTTVTEAVGVAPAGGVPAEPGATPAPPAPTESAAGDTAAGPAAAPAKTFGDPFTYCRSVGTIDYVDARYAGPPTVAAITQALSLPDTASRDKVRWRCVRGAVLACTSYGGPVCDLTPTVEEMRAFCARNQNVAQLLAPGGTWSCSEGQPKLPANASWPVDERGFLPAAWVVVRP